MNRKHLSFLFVLVLLSGCQQNNAGSPSQSRDQPSVGQGGVVTPVASERFVSCTSSGANEAVQSCLGESELIKGKLLHTLTQWTKLDGAWFPEMLDTKEFHNRYPLSQTETTCLTDALCKDVTYEN